MQLSATKREPAHYMLNIESFSILSKEKAIKIESDVFEASGHKWRLDIYPNGIAEGYMEDHISLYLVLCDSTENRSKGWAVLVDVKFFVYDHIHQKYVTFEEVDGKGTKFHEKQIEWGFVGLISLEEFKKPSKGYLFNDSCVFGAEVVEVPVYTLKERCLSMIHPPSTMNTYSWRVESFSQVTEKLTSEVFKVGNVNWTLSLYPKIKIEISPLVSIYLNVHEADLFPNGWRVYARYQIRVKNPAGFEEVRETKHWFCKSSSEQGFPHYMILSKVRDMSRGFLVIDGLIVEAKISVIGMLRNFI